MRHKCLAPMASCSQYLAMYTYDVASMQSLFDSNLQVSPLRDSDEKIYDVLQNSFIFLPTLTTLNRKVVFECRHSSNKLLDCFILLDS